jgi:hypothetical protein
MYNKKNASPATGRHAPAQGAAANNKKFGSLKNCRNFVPETHIHLGQNQKYFDKIKATPLWFDDNESVIYITPSVYVFQTYGGVVLYHNS